jgi:hypothetical protein
MRKLVLSEYLFFLGEFKKSMDFIEEANDKI